MEFERVWTSYSQVCVSVVGFGNYDCFLKQFWIISEVFVGFNDFKSVSEGLGLDGNPLKLDQVVM